MRICIIADSASARFGGEAILPLHYFRLLRRRGIEAWLVSHERTRDELQALLPDEQDRMHFVPDTAVHRTLFRLSHFLPHRIAESTVGLALLMYTQWTERRVVRALIREHGIDILHQPAPVAPSFPSMFFGMQRPLVIGPMNGGMHYPPAFHESDSLASRLYIKLARELTAVVNWLLPGKRHAATLLVANQRTAHALPSNCRGEVIELVENGVDLEQWKPVPHLASSPVRFVFIGRLVDWKALPIVLEAMVRVPGAMLDVIGDGPCRDAWQQHAEGLGLRERVRFLGWRTQQECAQELTEATALVLPSLYECGGAVVLEAMAMSRTVIATAWGGPCDYLNAETGYLIEPTGREAMVTGFAEAMQQLVDEPAKAAAMGAAARERLLAHFTWEEKIDRILEVYRSVLQPQTEPAVAVPNLAR